MRRWTLARDEIFDAGAENGPQLRLEELRMGSAQANASPAHERIGLALIAEVGNLLVAAEIERANGDHVLRSGFEDRAVDGQLVILIGDAGVGQEQIFRAIEPDAASADLAGHGSVGGAVDVGQ